MNKSTALKEAQLGRSYSSARGQLVRLVLFAKLKALGEDLCIRCGGKIETIEEFSLDHKEPWLHVDPALFWDVDNVLFAHQRCNSGARRPFAAQPSTKETRRVKFADWYKVPRNKARHNARRRKLYAQRKKRSVVTSLGTSSLKVLVP